MNRRVVADNENLGVLLSCTPNAKINGQKRLKAMVAKTLAPKHKKLKNT
jgi:hypothetical protein